MKGCVRSLALACLLPLVFAGCATTTGRQTECEHKTLQAAQDKGVRDAGKQLSDNTEKVTGIGGIFFRARDPARMSAWYRNHLGICAKDGHADFLWREQERPDELGRTVWAIFPADTEYFGPSRPTFMINYRVSNLDRMLAQLRQSGVAVEKVEDYDYGRFAWITDPEGNRIELWEPKSK